MSRKRRKGHPSRMVVSTPTQVALPTLQPPTTEEVSQTAFDLDALVADTTPNAMTVAIADALDAAPSTMTVTVADIETSALSATLNFAPVDAESSPSEAEVTDSPDSLPEIFQAQAQPVEVLSAGGTIDLRGMASSTPFDHRGGSLGGRLRLGRKAHGWTTEEIAHKLKLPMGVVQALEQDDFDKIEHHVYLRGYLLGYARLVGVPTVVVEGALKQRAESAPPLIATGTVPRSRYLFERYSVAATYVVLTALIGVPAVWLMLNGGLPREVARLAALDLPPAVETTLAPELQKSSAQTLELPSQPAPSAPPIETAGPPAVAFAAMPTNASPEPPLLASIAPFAAMGETPTETSPVAEAGQRFTLRLNQESWVEILNADGSRLEYGLLASGTSRVYHGRAPLRVRIGNARAAQILVEGQALDLSPYMRANVARFRLFSSDSLITPPDA